MRVVDLVPAIAGLLAVVQSEQFKIPDVEQKIQYMNQCFEPWVNNHGPPPYPSPPYPYPRPTTTKSASPSGTGSASCSYWLENIKHQGISAFNPDSSYTVFRNVKDYGAKGDGVTDDTAAINLAISSGNRCGPGTCQSSTLTPAIVYFPTGTYVVSSSIIDYYYTQLIGNANCPPTLQATANFSGLGVIDGDLNDAFGTTNIFWRQVRNFIIDMAGIPASTSATGIHWPTAQATSLQNILFQMATGNGTQHQGIYIESGSGGYMGDLTFNGGLYGLNVGNQQFTMRNMTFNNCGTAINQFWDWGWTYKSMYINNCRVGVNMSTGAPSAQSVGSVTFIDSSITNTPIGFITGRLKNGTSQPPAAGSLIIENVALKNVPIAVQGPDGTALAGTTGSTTIAGWGEGHAYVPNGPQSFEGSITPNPRPGALLQGDGKYYERSKPQYGTLPVTSFLSARSYGATGNGKTDDTAALQKVILDGAAQGKVVFVDAGTYKVTSTVYIPPGSKIVGETYPVIMSSGSFFNDWNNPQPMMQIGHPGESGEIEWSDMIVSTQGQQEGAVLIEWNLASSSSSPSGMWDVHARIGGFAGSNLQLAECPTTPEVATPPALVNSECIAAFLTMHVTKSATGLYMENVWLWTADHDVEDANLTQITVYTGRGLYVESSEGVLWLYGTAVEHHSKYQYQFADTKSVVMGQIQTETPYYQPNPDASLPFPTVASLNDPVFVSNSSDAPAIANVTDNISDAWGLRILDSDTILVYGAGLYSFFDDYSTFCCAAGNGEVCQRHIFQVLNSPGLSVYNLNTVGTTYEITLSGQDEAFYLPNVAGFIDNVALFRDSSAI